MPYKQLSLTNIFADCQNKFDNDKYEFLELFDHTIDIDEIVPVSFGSHFYVATGISRRHLLYPMLRTLLLQLIFSIPTFYFLIIFLKYSQELRDFGGFDVVPDASEFTRFKQEFLPDLQSMFDRSVDLAEPICQRIDADKASMALFDTSSIEAWSTENNPKYANHIIKQLKAFKKAHNLADSYGLCKAAYGSIAFPAVCMILPCGGNVKAVNPIYGKTLHLPIIPLFMVHFHFRNPALQDFCPTWNQDGELVRNSKLFLRDAFFDTIEIYKVLFHGFGFEKAFYPHSR